MSDQPTQVPHGCDGDPCTLLHHHPQPATQDDLEHGGVWHADGILPCVTGRPYPHQNTTECRMVGRPAATFREQREAFELPTVAALRQQLAEYEQLFELQHTRTREADERWRAEDPETRKAVHPDLGVLLTWLMTDADNARTQLAKAERERDSLARRLGTRFEETKELRRQTQHYRSLLAELADSSRRLVETLATLDKAHGFGHPDLDRCIGFVRNALERIADEHTRMTLTDKAAEYLDATGSAITGGRSFGDAAGEGSSDPEITADVNGSASTVADPSRSMHNWHYGASEAESAPDIATVDDRGETREPVTTTERYMMATRAIHKLGDLSREPANLALITGEEEHHWIGSWVEGYGYIGVRFPKTTTRPLTDAEIMLYDGHLVEVAGHDNYVIRIAGAGQ